MDITYSYRLLELTPGSSFAEIKAAYRRLARQYHPDINPNNQAAKDKFIALTEAYNLLLSVVSSAPTNENTNVKVPPQPSQTKVTTKQQPNSKSSQLSQAEELLKWNCYQEFQQLLKHQRFPKAIALIENLAQRLPQDEEVRSWHAIAYQRWGRELVNKKQLDKARVYLKKALKIDPHNRSLWSEVERDFRQLEKIF